MDWEFWSTKLDQDVLVEDGEFEPQEELLYAI